MSIVLDCSATLAWVHGDERTLAIENLFDRIIRDGAIVPSLWHLEIANGLTMAVRRKRITVDIRNEILLDLVHLNVVVDDETNTHAWAATMRIADKYGLTLYDAAYLELAQRRRLPLASLDTALIAAAREAGIEALP